MSVEQERRRSRKSSFGGAGHSEERCRRMLRGWQGVLQGARSCGRRGDFPRSGGAPAGREKSVPTRYRTTDSDSVRGHGEDSVSV